jgi:hypothetical protein
VNLFQDFLKQTNATVKEVTIATVKSGKQKELKGDQSVTPDMSVEDCYYTQKEYHSLSAAKKLALKLKRQKQGHNGGKHGNKNESKKRKKELVDLSQRTIKAIASELRPGPQVEESDESDDSAEEDEELSLKPLSKKGKQISNRTHPALRRVKK